MRTYLLSAALAVALVTPGAALAQSGHVDLGYADRTYDFGGFETDVEFTSLGGKFAFSPGPLGVQVDGRYANWGGDIDDAEAWNLGAHVFTRNESWLLGGYLGYDDIDDFNAEAWTGALEGQYYLARGTLSAVLSHSIWDGPDYAITMIEGEYRHFVNDNFSLHGGLGFGQGDIGLADPDVWSGAIGGEYMFAGAPVSIFGEYRHNSIEFNTGQIDVDTLSIGVRYDWGGSLIERSRSGAGLNRVLPIFDRFLS